MALNKDRVLDYDVVFLFVGQDHFSDQLISLSWFKFLWIPKTENEMIVFVLSSSS